MERSDLSFVTAIPNIIQMAEQRIYRELDLLATRVTDSTASFSSGTRNFTLPTTNGVFLVPEQINVITPTSSYTATNGTRVPLVNTSRDFIDITYPSNASGTSVPEFFAMSDNATIIVGPPPDKAYRVEVIGTQRPAALSSANSSTFLTQVLPDLFIAASMIVLANYADPMQPGKIDQQYWEEQYNKLSQSANVEELRKRYFSNAWTSQQPSPIATPPRV